MPYKEEIKYAYKVFSDFVLSVNSDDDAMQSMVQKLNCYREMISNGDFKQFPMLPTSVLLDIFYTAEYDHFMTSTEIQIQRRKNGECDRFDY